MMSLEKQNLYLKCHSDVSSQKDLIKRFKFWVEFEGQRNISVSHSTCEQPV